MKLIKTFLVVCFIFLTTTACAHHPHYHDSFYDSNRSSRIVIWGDNFAIDYRSHYRTPHRDFHHRGHFNRFPTTTCRNRWNYGGPDYFRRIRTETYHRSCIIRIPSAVSTPVHDPRPAFMQGNWCIQQYLTRISIHEIRLEEHKHSPPINCH